MIERAPCVYVLASGRLGTLYVGATSNLMVRVHQHREGVFEGFTSRHDVVRLVWFEMHATMAAAIEREKRLKNWRRAWKVELIEAENPAWRDPAEALGLPPLPPRPTRSSC